MAVPSFTFGRTFDPTDVDKVELQIGRGLDDANPLKPGERIASFTLVTTTAASIAGLAIPNDDPRKPTISDPDITADPVLSFWFAMTSAAQASAVFATLQTLLVELTIDTDSDPLRRRQITLGLKAQSN